MSNRVNAKLYRIQEIITQETENIEEYITNMVNAYYNKSGHQFNEVELNVDTENEDYESRLFIYTTEEKSPNWLNFLNEIAEREEDLLELQTKYSAFILFVYNVNRIYAVSKGYYGRFLIEDDMDNFFGLEVLSRLVDKNVTEIRKLEERAVFGAVLGAERYFREDYNLVYEDDFGKIYKTMLANIDEEHFERLGIVKKREDITKVSISGSSSFEVSTNFDFSELVQRINKIEELLETEGIQFNQFYRLSLSELRAIGNNLDQELIKMAYDAYVAGDSVDFYHPDIFNYMKSAQVRFNVVGDFKEIPLGQSLGFIELINILVDEDIIDSSSENSFIQSMTDCTGEFSLDEEGAFSRDASLDQWIGGEIEYDGKRFFKLDNQWYRYREGFNEYLNSYLGGINFSLLMPPGNLENWDFNEHETEGAYNSHYTEIPKFLVADKALLYNLEICDLIRITDDTLYLYHVKKGLGRDLRVLANQIISGARILTNAIREDNNESLEKYYDVISHKQYEDETLSYLENGAQQNLTKEEFVEIFKNRKISFVFAYSSGSGLEMGEEIVATNSRIAKLSLLYCIRDMKTTDFEFLIERITEIN
jgi:uncharacterized protein (TIGR04141 family)